MTARVTCWCLWCSRWFSFLSGFTGRRWSRGVRLESWRPVAGAIMKKQMGNQRCDGDRGERPARVVGTPIDRCRGVPRDCSSKSQSWTIPNSVTHMGIVFSSVNSERLQNCSLASLNSPTLGMRPKSGLQLFGELVHPCTSVAQIGEYAMPIQGRSSPPGCGTQPWFSGPRLSCVPW